ncbi:MAG TPA: hypothetical protein VJ256_03760, partial [Dehalococcoidia bacterium]|nr:hypothetical protein [Dehalococcoidia bacterium]
MSKGSHHHEGKSEKGHHHHKLETKHHHHEPKEKHHHVNGTLPLTSSLTTHHHEPKEKRHHMSKMNPKRVPITHLDPKVRVNSLDEVVVGYTHDEVVAEAQRCLNCHNAMRLCRMGCPIANEIPAAIQAVVRGDLAEAAR